MTVSFLSGKLALVTGGSGTIGQAIAKSLLNSGASVVLTARRLERLETVKDTLLATMPLTSADAPKVHVFSSDVSKEESVVELFQKIDELNGGVDLLINNAGTDQMQCTTSAVSPFSYFLMFRSLIFRYRYDGPRTNCRSFGIRHGKSSVR